MDLLLYSTVAWTIAQIMKISIRYYNTKSFQFKEMVGSGDFPSAHTTFSSCLMILVGFRSGFFSDVFAVVATLWGVVAYDSFHSRYSIGQQAKTLNKIGHELSKKGIIDYKPIPVFKGHTLSEMLGGFGLGTIVALILHFIFKV